MKKILLYYILFPILLGGIASLASFYIIERTTPCALPGFNCGIAGGQTIRGFPFGMFAAPKLEHIFKYALTEFILNWLAWGIAIFVLAMVVTAVRKLIKKAETTGSNETRGF